MRFELFRDAHCRETQDAMRKHFMTTQPKSANIAHNITITVSAEGELSIAERALATAEAQVNEYATAICAFEERMERISAWKQRRRRMNFDYLLAKFVEEERIAAVMESEAAFAELTKARTAAFKAFISQKTPWYKVKTSEEEFMKLMGCDELHKEYERVRGKLHSGPCTQNALLRFTAKQMRLYRDLILSRPECDSRTESLIYSIGMWRREIDADYGMCERKEKKRKPKNQPPTKGPFVDKAPEVRDYVDALRSAVGADGYSMEVNVPQPIYALVRTINGEEA